MRQLLSAAKRVAFTVPFLQMERFFNLTSEGKQFYTIIEVCEAIFVVLCSLYLKFSTSDWRKIELSFRETWQFHIVYEQLMENVWE